MKKQEAEERKRTRVFLVDDHPTTLDGLKGVLDAPDMEVVGTALTGGEAVAKVLSMHPDVVILDIQLPDISGLDVLQRIKAGTPGVAVVLLTAFAQPAYLLRGVMAGAAGFITKGETGEGVLGLVRRVAAGEDCLPRSLWEPLLNSLHAEAGRLRGRELAGWTEREIQILYFMSEGCPNSRIAEKLGVSLGAVLFHLKKVFGKLGVSDRTQAVVRAIERGVITVPSPGPDGARPG